MFLEENFFCRPGNPSKNPSRKMAKIALFSPKNWPFFSKLWGFFQMKSDYGVFSFGKYDFIWKKPHNFQIFLKFRIFPNENGKLWGFHLEKPHNFQKSRNSAYGVFANENPIIFDFHLEKSPFSNFNLKKFKKTEFLKNTILSL